MAATNGSFTLRGRSTPMGKISLEYPQIIFECPLSLRAENLKLGFRWQRLGHVKGNEKNAGSVANAINFALNATLATSIIARAN